MGVAVVASKAIQQQIIEDINFYIETYRMERDRVLQGDRMLLASNDKCWNIAQECFDEALQECIVEGYTAYDCDDRGEGPISLMITEMLGYAFFGGP